MTTPASEQDHLPVDPTASEAVPAAQTTADTPVETEPLNKPDLSEQVGDGETHGSRMRRSIGRTIALMVLMFAAGALTVYIAKFQPADLERQAAWAASTQAAGEALQLEKTAAAAEGSNKAAQVRMQNAETALQVEQGRVFLLRATNEITRARMALAVEDTAAAETALSAAQAHLEGLQPPLMVLSQEQLDTLNALFTLTKNDLTRDASLAAQDLDRLQSELDLAEQSLE